MKATSAPAERSGCEAMAEPFESDILEYGNGIYITDTTLDGESLYLEGYAASARQPDFTDEAGDLIRTEKSWR